jgi:hypothetical protein
VLAKIGFWPAQVGERTHVRADCKGISRSSAEHSLRVSSRPSGCGGSFGDEPENFSLRRYPHEQWDVMFFVQGVAEMILHDVRTGMPQRTMRFIVDGDNHRSSNNVGIVVPPGVAHAIRVEGSEDVIMVYGTSTSFRPEFEGRIAADVETAVLPESWQRFLAQ